MPNSEFGTSPRNAMPTFLSTALDAGCDFVAGFRNACRTWWPKKPPFPTSDFAKGQMKKYAGHLPSGEGSTRVV